MSEPSRSAGSPVARDPRRIRFQDLMRYRVHHILLVSSLYDSFILAEDGQVNEAILNQFVDLNLSQNPELTRVSTGTEALGLLAEGRRFDLVLTSLRVGDMHAAVPESIVEFVPVPVSLLNLSTAVGLVRARPFLDLAGIAAEAHRAPFVLDRPLIVHQVNDGRRAIREQIPSCWHRKALRCYERTR